MVKMTCFRFNLDKPEQAQAWEYLHRFEDFGVKSANIAVINAVNEYFDRLQKLTDDPYFENREREERFIQQIISEVGKALISEMPKFLTSFMLNLKTDYPTQAVQPVSMSAEENNEDDFSAIDLDFIGG